MSTATILGLLGITVGAFVTGLNQLYPSTSIWLIWAGGLSSTALLIAAYIAWKKSMTIKITDCGAAYSKIAIVLNGSAKLDSERFTSVNNLRLLEMNDQSEAKMRDTYYRAPE